VSASPFPSRLRALLKRVVEHPMGFQLLYQGHLESVAALFAVPPRAIEEAREWIVEPARRGVFAAELVAARRFHGEHPEIDHIHGRGSAPRVPPQRTADDLLHDVDALPDGAEFLLRAPPETIAVLFAVHPFVVHEARQRLRTREMAPPANEDPG
jgi:hypothetical protein